MKTKVRETVSVKDPVKSTSRGAISAVLLSSLMVFVALGFCSSANSIYVIPITEGLGISRSAYSVTTSLRFVTTAAVNVFFGSLVRRLGTKKLILVGFTFLTLSALVNSVAGGLPLLFVGSLFLGIGISFTTTTMVGTVINRACPKNTGIFLGIALAMNGLGAAIARIVLTPIIHAGDPLDYRNAYRVVAVILLVTAVIEWIFLKEHGAETPSMREKSQSDTAPRKVFDRPCLYFALAAIFLTGLVMQGMNGIADPHLKDSGMDLNLITVVLSIHSIAISFSKTAVGFVYDRGGVRVACGTCYGAALIALPALLFASSSPVGTAAGMVFSIVMAIAIPLQTVMLPIFVRELFDRSQFQKALGIFTAANTAGYAVGVPVANLIFDVTGSYDLWIVFSEVCIALIFVTMLAVIARVRKARTETAEAPTP